ncbi:MAG: MATE family efflux transporter [Kofleriaceae bacterium]
MSSTGRSEESIVREVVSVGGPRAVSLLGFVAMGVVDVAMVAPLGATSVAALALGNAFAAAVMILAVNLFAPVDVMISRALATGDHDTVTATHRSSLALVVALAVPLVLLYAFPEPILRAMGGTSAEDPELLAQATAFTRALAWGVPPALATYALRLFVEGHRRMRVTTWIIILANVVNAIGDWILIYGNAGGPELGSAGAAWSTSIVRMFMCLALVVYIARDPVLREHAGYRRPWHLDLARTWKIVSLGFPAGLRVGAREIYYALLVMLVARLGTDALTSHQVGYSLLMLANTAQMGFGWGASIVIARHHARGDKLAARKAVMATGTIAISAAVVVATIFVAFAGPIARQYSSDPETIAVTTNVLRACAIAHLAAAWSFIGAAGIFALLEMKFAAKVGITIQFAFALPCAWLILNETTVGVPGVWLVTAASEVVVGIAFMARFRARTR